VFEGSAWVGRRAGRENNPRSRERAAIFHGAANQAKSPPLIFARLAKLKRRLDREKLPGTRKGGRVTSGDVVYAQTSAGQ
jgi:hypothetical protein